MKKKKMHPGKRYLLEIRKIDAMLENKKAELKYWNDIALSSTLQITERVQSSGSQQIMADAVVNALSVQEEINDCVIALKNKKDEIIDVIEQLNVDEYDLLHKVYIQYYTLKEYQWFKKTSYRSVISIHGNALNNVMHILERKKDE